MPRSRRRSVLMQTAACAAAATAEATSLSNSFPLSESLKASTGGNAVNFGESAARKAAPVYRL